MRIPVPVFYSETIPAFDPLFIFWIQFSFFKSFLIDFMVAILKFLCKVWSLIGFKRAERSFNFSNPILIAVLSMFEGDNFDLWNTIFFSLCWFSILGVSYPILNAISPWAVFLSYESFWFMLSVFFGGRDKFFLNKDLTSIFINIFYF